ncbi:hypothetical protein [Leptolyngbya sp. FACHB-541]|nr:hypothetical protein [Leptolyngbya sp. FACHB-541]
MFDTSWSADPFENAIFSVELNHWRSPLRLGKLWQNLLVVSF